MAPTDERVRVADAGYLHVRRWPGRDAAVGGAPTRKRPFLLVPGLSGNARLWDEVARELSAAGHPVRAVDPRSHGDSDAPPEGYDTGTAAEDLAALGVPGAIVVGHAWGGDVAVVLAAKHPEAAAALALVDGGWLDLSAEFTSWEDCEQALRPPDIDGLPAEELRGYLRRGHPGWSGEAVEATLCNKRVWPDGTLSPPLPLHRHMPIVCRLWDDPPQRYYPS